MPNTNEKNQMVGDRHVSSQSPQRKVMLYNSGSVSKIFFAKKTDTMALSHNKKHYKDLLQAAS